MNVVSQRGLKQLIEKHPEAQDETIAWYRKAHKASWVSLQDVRRDFPSVDKVGAVLIFDIRNNRYRLIVRIDFPTQRLFVKALLTHKEYDRGEWKKWV